MRRTYPLRDRLHPEVMVRGSFFKPILDKIDSMMARARHPCSGQVQRVLDALGDTDTTHGQMMWAIRQWARCGKPVYYIEPGLAEALTHTDFPWEHLEKLELPDEALYIALPPIFSLEHLATGEHPVEGVYLVKDTIAVRVADGKAIWRGADDPMGPEKVVDSTSEGYEQREGVSVVGIGAPRAYILGHEEQRDDAIITTNLITGMPLAQRNYLYGGVEEILRVVVNLLYMMNYTRACERERVVPEVDVKGSRERNKRRAVEQVERKGKSLLPYTILRLSPRVQKASARPGVPARKARYQTWVPGHFHSYWVLDPGDEKVLEKKEGKGGTLHRVARFLSPYKKGEGLPEKPRTVVVVR